MKLVGDILLWCLAVIAMIALAFIVYTHRVPFPFELTLSKDVQVIAFPAWVQDILRFMTAINDPLPDVIIVILTVVVFVLLRWFMEAIFLALSTMVGNGVDALIGDVVQRPRPSPKIIHVDSLLTFNSFPSGHCCHVMVFYGFLLYLSFTPAVRQWRYRWALLPLQIFAFFTILVMGFARLWEGEHWVTDIIAGYLDGLIWLCVFIFLYQWTTERLRERRIRHQVAH